MKIAFLAWTSIEPPDSGYRIRSRALIDHWPDEQPLVLTPEPILQSENWHALPRPILSHLPLPINGDVLSLHRRSKAASVALKALHDYQPDIVCCEGLWPFSVAAKYREETGTPVLLDVHNIECIAAKKKGRSTLKSSILSRLEQRAYPQCDYLVACSQSDRERLSNLFKISPDKILVVPNGVHAVSGDSETTQEPFQRRLDEKVLLFLGKMNYPPNREAVNFFFQQLVPRLEKASGDFLLALVGQPAPRINIKLPHHIRILAPGRVEDIEPWLRSADVCLAPIFSGSGTRIKILEYLAAGKPVVATRKAAEGLEELKAGRDYAVGETGIEFTAQVLRCLSNNEHAAAMAQHGRQCVAQHYLWEYIVKRFHGELKAML